MNTDIKLKVTEIQRFCMHDGPGLRTTVFLKGCPLRCGWCHNPETQKKGSELLLYPVKCIGCGACAEVCPENVHLLNIRHEIYREKCKACGKCSDVFITGAVEICGKDMTVSEILSAAERDRAFYGESGGVTLSGGEPLMQGVGAIALLSECKARWLSTAVETCGEVKEEVLRAAAPLVDLFLWDIKDTDGERHKRYTGVGNEVILENLFLASEMNARIRIRCILVNGVNTEAEHYERIADIALKIKNLDAVELIPYHAYGGSKAVFIGREDNGKKEWIPTEKRIDEAVKAIERRGVRCICNGRNI